MTTWRVRLAADDGTNRVIRVSGEADAPAASLPRSLDTVGFHGDELYVNGAAWSHRTGTLGESGLVHGAHLASDPKLYRASELQPGRYLVAITGPCAGEAEPLNSSRVVSVGRSPMCSVTVDDEAISWDHFQISCDNTGDYITDLVSSNGTQVDGLWLDEANNMTEVLDGSIILAGGTIFAVVHVAHEDAFVQNGSTETAHSLQRQFRKAIAPIPSVLEPQKPNQPSPAIGGSAVWQILMSLLTGGAFAAITGRWLFLAVGAIGPIVRGVMATRDRAKQRADTRLREELFRAETKTFEADVSRLRREEVRNCWNRSLGGGMSTFIARIRHKRIWERQPTDVDFGHVVIGYTQRPSEVSTTRTEDQESDRPLIGPVPFSVSLVEAGPLAIIGDSVVARGVARSLILEAASMHAPAEMKLWVISDAAREHEWEFVRWLPHSSRNDGGGLMGLTAEGRSNLIQRLKATIENRKENDIERAIPNHLVVIDGVSTLSATDLTELLRDGPLYGVSVVLIDEQIVAEGVRCKLAVTRNLDRTAFTSTGHQPIDALKAPSCTADIAMQTALAMAPLQSFAVDDQLSFAKGSVFLSEQLNVPNPPAEALKARWESLSPTTKAVCGSVGHGPFTLDIMADGPHGLVAGTTRSGKTEFLKSLFVSLAANNHPDDLSIAIIDFKGGVDHALSSQLPHVIGLSTNRDIAGFSRAIAMLKAEQLRRQSIFESVGANNLDAYRISQQNDPDLPKVPRLLVVVDEFSELLGNEESKAELGSLESVTRIGGGLGIHLLLATQNFQNQLPDQIAANSGIRICFRVQDAAHSKIVLGSHHAATISASTIGRAFVRLQGRELVEVQGSRVANRRRDLRSAGDQRMTVAPIAASEVALAVPTVPDLDIPAEQTDMFLMVEAAQEAAALTGWVESAIPWPAPLPEVVTLESLLRSALFKSPIGLADYPVEQATKTVFFDQSTTTALIGSATSGLTEYVSTALVSHALRTPAAELHVYGIDVDGRGLDQLAPLPHVGAIVTRNDARALRVVSWTSMEARRRKALFSESRATAVTGKRLPQIVLVIAGADRITAFNEGAVSPLLQPLKTLLNEIAGTGIQVVLTGSPSLTHRLGSFIERSFVFDVTDPSDLSLLGVPRPHRGSLANPGRAVEISTGKLVQFATFHEVDVFPREIVSEIANGLAPVEEELKPELFWEVPWPLDLASTPATAFVEPPSYMALALPVGFDIATGLVMWIDAIEEGPILGVAGGPKSGRSNTLAAIAQMAGGVGWATMAVPASRRSPLFEQRDLFEKICEPHQAAAVAKALHGTDPLLVCVDDAHRLKDTAWIPEILEQDRPILILFAGSVDRLKSSTGPMRNVPISNGIVLAPSSSGDGSAVGAGRLDAELLVQPRAGVGVLGIAGEAFQIQLPKVLT